MKKPPKHPPKKKRFTRLKAAFAAGALLFIGGTAAVVKNWSPPLPRETQEPEALKETFKKRSEQEILLAKIDHAIERIEKNDTNSDDFALTSMLIPEYANNRGYMRDNKFKLDQESPVVYYLTWDLHMLGFYKKDLTRKFSTDVIEALVDFQKKNGLPENLQPDPQTLKKLAEQSYYQRILVGLYAWKVGIRRGTSVQEKLLVIGAESSGNRFTKADTSSAVGLGQFTEETAIFVIASDGHKMGLKDLQKDAREIQEIEALKRQKKPAPSMTPKLQESRQRILALRTEFEPSIDMMALYGMRMTKGFVAQTVYLHYLLGSGGAQKIIDNPGKKAADILPNAAESNPDLFYASELTPVLDKKGNPKKDKKGRVVREYAPLTTEQLRELAAKKVTDAPRVAEAAATEVIMRNFIAQMTEPPVKPAPVAGNTFANRLN